MVFYNMNNFKHLYMQATYKFTLKPSNDANCENSHLENIISQQMQF